MPGAFLNEITVDDPRRNHPVLRKSPCVTTAAEAMENYKANCARTWYEDDADPIDTAGKYAFQRLRET